MSRKKKFACTLFACDVLLAIVALFLPYGLIVWLGLNAIGALLLIAFLLGNKFVRKTAWYQNLNVDPHHAIFPDNVWYREHDERNFDVVNLGSSGGKWAFNYEGLSVKAMNWAIQPQTLVDDFRIMKNFHSILRHKGYVIITIMPFTGLNKQTGFMDTYKYVGTLAETLLDNRYTTKARLFHRFPLLFGKQAIKAVIKGMLHKEKTSATQHVSQDMTTDQLEADAKRWIDGWKKQFDITDFDAPLTPSNQEGRKFRIDLMQQLVDFCIERSYIPVYVIPPVTKHLAKYYTPKFEQTYIYSFLSDVQRDVRVLDYSKVEELQRDEFYFNSFFLNEKGAKLFTTQVLTEIGLV